MVIVPASKLVTLARIHTKLPVKVNVVAVLCAVLSCSEDFPIPAKTCFAGEVGLSGEIRPVTRIEQRIREAEKLGFETIYVSGYGLKGISTKGLNILVKPVKRVDEVFQELFG